MKKTYLIIALSFLSIVSCKDKESDETTVSMDDTEMVDTVMTTETEMDSASMAMDSTNMTESGDGKVLDKIDETTRKVKVDNTSGKYTLTDTNWKLVEVAGKAVKSNESKDYYINLDSKSGKLSGFVGCNSVMGRYVMIDATKLQFSNVASTKVRCNDNRTETKFMNSIAKVENYSIEGSTLYLNKTNLNDVLKFEAVK